MNTNPISLWTKLLHKHARQHKAAALGLWLALVGVLILLIQSVIQLTQWDHGVGLRLALIGSSISFATTALGALPIFVLKNISQRVEDSLLGMAAGMMLAASAFSLLLPGLEAGTEILGNKALGAAIVVIGMGLGVLLMLGLDSFTPHEHPESGPWGPGHQKFERVWLFVFAIALHNLPEGMAIGVSFSQSDMNVGVPVTTAIALQNIPEGLAVALALRSAGFTSAFAFIIAALSGLMEPVGAILGVSLASGFPVAYPIGLGLAAGAMIYVVVEELIPELQEGGHSNIGVIGVALGFTVMMILDVALG